MSEFVQRLVKRRWDERLNAFLTGVPVPMTSIDLGTWRRLEAMRDRVAAEDPELAADPDAMEHVVYAAIVRGLDECEKDAGVAYDSVTGERL